MGTLNPHSRPARILGRKVPAISAAVFAVLIAAIFGPIASAQLVDTLDPARNARIHERGKARYYPDDKWDLSGLPSYKPAAKVAGTIRIWGSNYVPDGQLEQFWEDGFRKYHPEVKFERHLRDSLTAIGGLYTERVTSASDHAPTSAISPLSSTLLIIPFSKLWSSPDPMMCRVGIPHSASL